MPRTFEGCLFSTVSATQPEWELCYCRIIHLLPPVNRGKMSHPGLECGQGRRL